LNKYQYGIKRMFSIRENYENTFLITLHV
jgi:hypothetical protein